MSTGDDIGPDDDLLVAEYALGVLPHDERVALARRIAGDGLLAARLRAWEAHLASLGQDLDPVQPPVRVMQQLEGRLFPAPQVTAGGLWGSLRFWRGLSAALLGLVLLAGAMALGPSRTAAPPGQAGFVAELGAASDAVKLVAFYDARSGTLNLNRLAGDAPSGRDFQLWLIAGETPPVSLGVLPREARAALRLPAELAARLGPRAILAVSDEPLGGSPTGLPTGAVLATGPLNAI